MQPATIKLFLVKGLPNSLRTAELSNWSGKVIASPRTELQELLRREEMNSSGFYILTGVDPDSGENAIYIGEAEDVSKRLKKHISKDFWNSVTVFVSKDDNLTKAHVRYLEGLLIRMAYDAGNAIVMNNVNSGARLPESDEAEMQVFLEKCLQLLPVLGVNDFRRIDDSNSDEALLYFSIKGIKASGKRTTNGFIVFKDSQAMLESRPSGDKMKEKRDIYIAKGLLQKKEDYLVFTRDIEFGSPSTAAGIIAGGETNGLISWKDSAGRTLKAIEESSERIIKEQ